MSAEPKEEREGPGLPEIDLREWGGRKEGERQSLDRRLFFQLLAFDVHDDVTQAISALSNAISQAHIPALLLRELNAPRTIAILSWSEEPLHFIERILPLFEDRERFAQRREYTMLGRTYSLGHEPELEHALLHRPVEYCLREGWDWHVWYPLRRSGAFERLSKHEQAILLKEHAAIGMAYGRAEYAHDIRLACHGLDVNDNEFVIGLVGKELYPLSHLVQTMRHTRHTSEFISRMGPFFVGRVLFRCPGQRR
ncbi:MAG: chlorite dismutase family protein [Sandaracinaceae bacterium]|nr:chlorite dismutase family protein [Sandaracinaceae bacterium]MDW8247043.1 chlorite dismutase family protein [Sandaracinaceae bacterium]